MVVNLLGTVAQWERETVVERTRTALEYKRRKGEWMGRLPFGFTIDEAGRLVEDPAPMKVIVAMKRARRRHASFPEIVKRHGVSAGTAFEVEATDLRVLRNRVLAATARHSAHSKWRGSCPSSRWARLDQF